MNQLVIADTFTASLGRIQALSPPSQPVTPW